MNGDSTVNRVLELQQKSDDDLVMIRILDLLDQLEGLQVCILANAVDGGLQQLKNGRWTSIDGGEHTIIGTILDKGVEDSNVGFESYIIVNSPGEALKKIFFSVITWAMRYEDDAIPHLLKALLFDEDDDVDLEKYGFRWL
jgi:hypothetical protein